MIRFTTGGIEVARKRGAPKKQEADKLAYYSVRSPKKDYGEMVSLAKVWGVTLNIAHTRLLREALDRHPVMAELDLRVRECEAALEHSRRARDSYVEARGRAIEEVKVKLMDFYVANLDLIKVQRLPEAALKAMISVVSQETGIEYDLVLGMWKYTPDRYYKEFQPAPEQAKAVI